jgi:phosphate-selective porin OprO/OprP
MNLSRLTCTFLSIAALSVGARAQSTVEERLQALEARIEQLARENAELRARLAPAAAPTPAPSAVSAKPAPAATVHVQPAGKEAKLTVGGFLQGQAEFGRASDPRWADVRDRFFFRRARVYVAGSFTEDFDFKAELDLQGNTLSAGTGHRAQANEVFVNWRKYPEAMVRFGQLKPAFGAEQLASDTKTMTIERYLGSDRLTDGRQLAVSLWGDLADKKVSYMLVAANGNGSNVSANDNSKFQRSARVAYTPFATKENRVTFGANGLWTEDAAVTRAGLGFTGNTFAGKREGMGVDVHGTFGRADFGAEWLQMTYRPTNAVPYAKFDASGWHVTAGYYVLPAKLQAVVRRESFDPNSRRGGDVIDSWLFGLNYFIKGDDLKLQVNYLHGDTPGAATDGGRLLTRVQVLF